MGIYCIYLVDSSRKNPKIDFKLIEDFSVEKNFANSFIDVALFCIHALSFISCQEKRI